LQPLRLKESAPFREVSAVSAGNKSGRGQGRDLPILKFSNSQIHKFSYFLPLSGGSGNYTLFSYLTTMKNEIVLYRPDEITEHIEVRLEQDTVWLSLNQIAQLFKRDNSVISRHLRNIYQQGELNEEATVAKNATVQTEADRKVKRVIEYYNLDAILSVGYRVNSKQGTQFRIWATNVLREYLLKGYAVNQRIDRIENNLENLSTEVNRISLQQLMLFNLISTLFHPIQPRRRKKTLRS